MAIALWHLATNGDYRSIGHLFGVAKGTVCVMVNEVCHAVVKVLFNKYIKLPTGSLLKETVLGFESKFGFPQCAGAIDGTHIPILPAKDNPRDNYNRKGFYSILMQALVDNNYCFADVLIGWPGSVHDT